MILHRDSVLLIHYNALFVPLQPKECYHKEEKVKKEKN